MKSLLNQWIDKRISQIEDKKLPPGNPAARLRTPKQATQAKEMTMTPRSNIMNRRPSTLNEQTPLPVKTKNGAPLSGQSSGAKDNRVVSRRRLALDPDNPFNTEANDRELHRSRSQHKRHFVECPYQGCQDPVTDLWHPQVGLEARVLDTALGDVRPTNPERTTTSASASGRRRPRATSACRGPRRRRASSPSPRSASC